MGEEEVRRNESKFFAINSLREIIKEEKAERDGKEKSKKFIEELQWERELLGYNHLVVVFETREELRVDNHTGCITLKTPKIGDLEKNIDVEEDFAILNMLSAKQIVKYGEILV